MTAVVGLPLNFELFGRCPPGIRRQHSQRPTLPGSGLRVWTALGCLVSALGERAFPGCASAPGPAAGAPWWRRPGQPREVPQPVSLGSGSPPSAPLPRSPVTGSELLSFTSPLPGALLAALLWAQSVGAGGPGVADDCWVSSASPRRGEAQPGRPGGGFRAPLGRLRSFELPGLTARPSMRWSVWPRGDTVCTAWARPFKLFVF